MQKALLPLFLLLISVSLLMAQSKKHDTIIHSETAPSTSFSPIAEGVIEAAGDVLYSFQIDGNGTNAVQSLGVTIYNDTVIVSSSGYSSGDITDNMFFRYTLDGTFIDSVAQNGTAGWGYRDMAFDGTYILASDNTEIRKFDPTTLALVTSVTNPGNNPHRGLAYDAGEDAIYSTNFTSGPLLKMNAADGATLRTYPSPAVAPYGIALDPYTNPGSIDLWYAEPSDGVTFRLSRVDTATGNVNFSFDLTSSFPGASSGGLEIINNHPDYPGKIIAVMLVQTAPDVVAFIDLTLAGSPKPPTNVLAAVAPVEVDANITWTDPTEDLLDNPITIDSVQVWRGDTYLGSVAGGVQSFTDVSAPNGAFIYKAVAYAGTEGSAPGVSNQLLIGLLAYDDFEGGVLPANWTIVNANADAYEWEVYNSTTYNHSLGGTYSLAIRWNSAAAMDDWAFHGPLTLDEVKQYTLNFWYVIASATYPENLKVTLNTEATAGSVVSTLWDMVGLLNTTHELADIQFSPPSSGDYYIGFHGYSAADMFRLAIDDISMWESGVVPVELTSFSASVSEAGVTLNWATATETNNSGFSIERSVDNVDFNSIAFVDGMGTTSEKTSYTYVDNSISAAKAYYRLKQIDFDGTSAYSNVVEVDLNVPTDFSISQNYPNPFNPSTTIKFGLPVEAKVTINLFNTLGEKVAQLANTDFAAGNQRIDFNASNLSSGVYFYTIEAVGVDGTNFVSSKKMMLMK